MSFSFVIALKKKTKVDKLVSLFCNVGNLIKSKSDLWNVKLISEVHFRVLKLHLEFSVRGK